MRAAAILASVAVAGAAAIYQASEWWERAYATRVSSETSPDGCLRVDTYEAFWVLPSVLHRIPDPDPEHRYNLGMRWDAAVFKRAYEVNTGDFLGETIVFDPSAGDDLMRWGDTKKPGRRVVVANGFPLIDSSRCSDPTTLAKLEAFHERQREVNRAILEAQEEARRPAIRPTSAGR